jgi:hypothetical protein
LRWTDIEIRKYRLNDEINKSNSESENPAPEENEEDLPPLEQVIEQVKEEEKESAEPGRSSLYNYDQGESSEEEPSRQQQTTVD